MGVPLPRPIGVHQDVGWMPKRRMRILGGSFRRCMAWSSGWASLHQMECAEEQAQRLHNFETMHLQEGRKSILFAVPNETSPQACQAWPVVVELHRCRVSGDAEGAFLERCKHKEQAEKLTLRGVRAGKATQMAKDGEDWVKIQRYGQWKGPSP